MNEQEMSEPFLSPRRLFNATRLYLWFVARDEAKWSWWRFVQEYRR